MASELNNLSLNGDIYIDKSFDLVVGEVIMFPHDNYSNNASASNSSQATSFLPCNGQSYNTSTYSDLYSIISTLHGSVLPNLNNTNGHSTSNTIYILGD